MHNFPRPTEPRVHAPRTPVDGACPECGAHELQSYRVLSEGGWWNVVKCHACLASVKREPGSLLGAITPLGADL